MSGTLPWIFSKASCATLPHRRRPRRRRAPGNPRPYISYTRRSVNADADKFAEHSISLRRASNRQFAASSSEMRIRATASTPHTAARIPTGRRDDRCTANWCREEHHHAWRRQIRPAAFVGGPKLCSIHPRSTANPQLEEHGMD